MLDIVVDNNSPEEKAMRKALADIEKAVKERLKSFKKTNMQSKKDWILQHDQLLHMVQKFMKMVEKYCNG